MDEELIMGIDVGIANVGIALIKADNGKLVHLQYLTTNPKDKFQDRLRMIHDEIEGLIMRFSIDKIVFEEVHLTQNSYKNNSMLRLNMVVGVILLLCSQFDIEPMLLSPVQIKLLMGGKGNCDKKTIQRRLLYVYPSISARASWQALFEVDHVSDALAQARTCWILSMGRKKH